MFLEYGFFFFFWSSFLSLKMLLRVLFREKIQRLCHDGTLLNVMWQPGWEGSLGEKGYVYMYG